MPYGFIITKDHTEGGEEGVVGPRGCALSQKFIRENGKQFRLYDDDEELYYTGLIAGDYEGFEPLDDFGMPNAGCTRIDYKQEDGTWETL